MFRLKVRKILDTTKVKKILTVYILYTMMILVNI